jgi:hypothetical protein
VAQLISFVDSDSRGLQLGSQVDPREREGREGRGAVRVLSSQRDVLWVVVDQNNLRRGGR